VDVVDVLSVSVRLPVGVAVVENNDDELPHLILVRILLLLVVGIMEDDGVDSLRSSCIRDDIILGFCRVVFQLGTDWSGALILFLLQFYTNTTNTCRSWLVRYFVLKLEQGSVK